MSVKTDNPLIELKLYSPLKIHTDIIENLTQKPAGELFKFISSMADKEIFILLKKSFITQRTR